MKILFTMTPAFDSNAGGVQRTTFKLGKYFAMNNLSVGYFSTADKGHVQPEYGSLFHSKYPDGLDDKRNIAHLEMVLKEFNPDIVINQMPYINSLRNILSRRKSELDYVLLGCLRNSLFNFKNNAREIIERKMPNKLFRLFDYPFFFKIIQFRHKLKHAKELKSILDKHDKFILLSPTDKDELKYFVGNYKNEKISVIPNSIPSISKASLKKKEKVLLHVGRLNIHQKRSDLLLPIWNLLYKKLPDWKFIIVGDGEYHEALQQGIENSKTPRIELVGYKEPEPYYERASAFILPSAFEGFPNTLIEAQSYGCFPFAFNSFGSLKWIGNDGMDIILIKPFDIEAMVDSILEYCYNSSKNILMQNALTNVQRFTIVNVGKIWMDLFKNLKSDYKI